MSRPLFTVEYTTPMQGRGLVLLGFTADQHDLIKPGDHVRLKLPNGSVLSARIVGVDFPPMEKLPDDTRYGIVIDRDNIPLGTEVYLDK